MAQGEELDRVRSELRRLGYLDHGFERFLLQDALRPRQPLRTLALLTAKVGLLAGAGLALVLAFLLAVANGDLLAGPFEVASDVAVLFLHLFPPISVVTALAFLALCGLVLLVLRLYPVRHIETLSLVAAIVAGASGLALAVWLAQGVLVEGSFPQLALLGVAAPVAIYILVKLTYHGLLTLAIRFTQAPPQERLFSRRWVGLALLSAIFLLTLPAVVLPAREGNPPAPATLPMAPGERVLLLGIDGVLPEELAYLLAVGDLPTLGRLAREEEDARYARRDEPPASFWTTVATGLPGPDHGVIALDSFQPLGVRMPLARSGPLRAYWSRIEVPLGLAEYRAVLANRRRAFTFWELASRGGAPVLAVNWWATYPAEPLPGLVVAHGAYQLLGEGGAAGEGAVAPAAAQPEVAALARETGIGASAGGDLRLAAALPPEAANAVRQRALLPDRFYREIFTQRLASSPRAAALYLPGLDIAADGWRGGDIAFADLVRAELLAADRLLAQALSVPEGGAGIGTVAVVLDPGRRREGGEGRILLWRRTGCAASWKNREEMMPGAVASGLLRSLGLPQSEELAPPPAGCRWPAAPVVLPSYGEPHRAQPPRAEAGEYLENLRSLGYL